MAERLVMTDCPSGRDYRTRAPRDLRGRTYPETAAHLGSAGLAGFVLVQRG